MAKILVVRLHRDTDDGSATAEACIGGVQVWISRTYDRLVVDRALDAARAFADREYPTASVLVHDAVWS